MCWAWRGLCVGWSGGVFILFGGVGPKIRAAHNIMAFLLHTLLWFGSVGVICGLCMFPMCWVLYCNGSLVPRCN